MAITLWPTTSPQLPPAMAFVDGTNLFHRLEAAHLKLQPGALFGMVKHVAGGHQIVRAYLYTSEPHEQKALSVHGEEAFARIRIIRGHAVETGDGNFKEKGVDALLVADLVYHAALKNYGYAILISTDTDFAQALRRVEDFGCQTAVVGVCGDVPELLRKSADQVHQFDAVTLTQQNLAQPIPPR